jgi:hypothetical protein
MRVPNKKLRKALRRLPKARKVKQHRANIERAVGRYGGRW